ncbi:MAG TPA: hypothetical protein VFW40_04345, partial [Capsulimonadaceae bacterium]|nr:hypothetical protein [Capsulimonadaceae bacterium]
MIRFGRILAAAMLAAFLLTAGATIAWSQNNGQRQLHSKITPAEKQASNNLMSQAVGQLNSAEGVLGGGNYSGASAYINNALADMRQALPIYRGWRVKAIEQSRRALRMLLHPKRA